MTTEKAEAAFNKWYERAEEPDTWETIWNNVQGRWTELSGHFKQNYGQSVDDDLAQSRGRRDILAGMIQREYNVSRGEAFEMIDDWAYGSYRQPNIPSGGAR